MNIITRFFFILGILQLFQKIDGFFQRQKPVRYRIRPSKLILTKEISRISRGGSIVLDSEEEEDDEDDDVEESDHDTADEGEGNNDEEGKDDTNKEDDDEDEEEEEEDEEEEEKPKATSPPKRISILFKTNTGNPLIDVTLEEEVSSTRTVESLKDKTLSRRLPGRPPASIINLRYEGVLLEDEALVSEIFEDDEDEEDEEEKSSKVLTLEMIPGVDAKFGTEIDDEIKDLSTADLLEAYTTNMAAMYQNGDALFSSVRSTYDEGENDEEDEEDDDEDEENPSSLQAISLRLQEQSMVIREKMMSKFSEEELRLMNEDGEKSDDEDTVRKRRGQRVRNNKGGVITGYKQAIQTNMNINWPETIWRFALFLFFGILGGHSDFARILLIMGAPACFFLQARPTKILLKQIFYLCSNPPPIALSLLPAPDQTILEFDYEKELKALYGVEPEELNETNDDDDDDDVDDIIESLEDSAESEDDIDDISDDDAVEEIDEEEDYDDDDDDDDDSEDSEEDEQ